MNSYYNIYDNSIPSVIDDNLLHIESNEIGYELKLTQIETGKNVWVNKDYTYDQYPFNIIRQNRMFGDQIIDLTNGKTLLNLRKEINTSVRKMNTDFIDESTMIVFDTQQSNMYRIDFINGKILWKTKLDLQYHNSAVRHERLINNDNACAYKVSYALGKPDASIDQKYDCCWHISLIIVNKADGNLVIKIQSYEDVIIDDDLVAYIEKSTITCFDTSTMKVLWKLETGNKDREFRDIFIRKYKSAFIVPLKDGVSAIDKVSGNHIWTYPIDDSDYWAGNAVITDDLISIDIETGRYSDYASIEGNYICYHYCHNHWINLQSGALIIKTILFDDTLETITGIRQGKANGFSYEITSSGSTKSATFSNSPKIRTTIRFKDSKEEQTFELNDRDRIHLIGIGVVGDHCRPYVDGAIVISSIKKINQSYYLFLNNANLYDNNPIEYFLEKTNGVSKLTESRNVPKISFKVDESIIELDPLSDELKRLDNNKIVWKIDIERSFDDNLLYCNGKKIMHSLQNEVTLVDLQTGEKQIMKGMICLNDAFQGTKSDTLKYYAYEKDTILEIHKFIKPFVRLYETTE